MKPYPTGRALILGGSCELAIGVAMVMVEKGLHPIVTYRSDRGRARIDESLQHAGGRYTGLPLDLSKRASFTPLRQELDQGMDYLVDFAHGELEGLVASADKRAVVSYFETNIANRAEVLQQVSRIMTAQRNGRMVYVSSAAAQRPNPGQGYYAAAKRACEALYRNVGLELAARGVTTVTLRPGYIDAGRGLRYLEKKADHALDKVPLARALGINEVVDTIMFLLSDSAVGFNATELTMDGGLTSGK
ncbi:MAG: SDR family oxidoreductase [Desulfobacteraceae bacterium]|jgi:3-oxoacyl-[acyl-carrier protein] reductase